MTSPLILNLFSAIMDEIKTVLEDEMPPEQSSVRWDHLTSAAKNRDRLTSSQMCFVKTLLNNKVGSFENPFYKIFNISKGFFLCPHNSDVLHWKCFSMNRDFLSKT